MGFQSVVVTVLRSYGEKTPAPGPGPEQTEPTLNGWIEPDLSGPAGFGVWLWLR